MIVKVCGINDLENFLELSKLPVDILGMVFYPQSPRAVKPDDQNLAKAVSEIQVKKAGVFVDEDVNQIRKIAMAFNLTYIQLHGNETPAVCRILKEEYMVIKAFKIGSEKDMETIKEYDDVADLFLFDTRGEKAGGSGVKFDWNLLKDFTSEKPYLLSGGIAPEDAEQIKKLDLPGCIGVDINSRFEVYPGKKDITKVEYFISKVK